MTIDDIKQLIARDETRTMELKKSTGELKDGMHSACAMLNTDGGWLLFGIAPVSLKIQGRVVTDKTRHEIANALTGLEPAIDDMVEIVNPGRLPNGWTTETIMQSHESRPRDPVIADVLYLSTYLESWGSGEKRMIEACNEAGAHELDYKTDNGLVTVVFRRSDRQISAEMISKKRKVSSPTIYREIKAINKVMKLFWEGPSKAGHWVKIRN